MIHARVKAASGSTSAAIASTTTIIAETIITSWSRSSSGTTISPLDAPSALLMQRMFDACSTAKIRAGGCDLRHRNQRCPHLVSSSVAAHQLAQHALRLEGVHRP